LESGTWPRRSCFFGITTLGEKRLLVPHDHAVFSPGDSPDGYAAFSVDKKLGQGLQIVGIR
jgi:hypothetical protein